MAKNSLHLLAGCEDHALVTSGSTKWYENEWHDISNNHTEVFNGYSRVMVGFHGRQDIYDDDLVLLALVPKDCCSPKLLFAMYGAQDYNCRSINFGSVAKGLLADKKDFIDNLLEQYIKPPKVSEDIEH